MTNEEIESFFRETRPNILGNENLREPQRDGYQAIFQHIQESTEPSYVQLPVGCGKSGLIGLTPFGLASGRVLIVTPNLTIRKTVYDELNLSDPDCFYTQRNVLKATNGPFISVLKTGANIHDCDNAHLVIANIQQFTGANNRWYEKLPPDYFRMILVDEGHHNVAETWRRLFDYFENARVVSFTATPLRSESFDFGLRIAELRNADLKRQRAKSKGRFEFGISDFGLRIAEWKEQRAKGKERWAKGKTSQK